MVIDVTKDRTSGIS